MDVKCLFGHQWNGCTCTRCGKVRDQEHNWAANCGQCSVCGQRREGAHQGDGCHCTICGKASEDAFHDWQQDCERCSKCGRRRYGAHTFSGRTCSRCGKPNEISALVRFITNQRKALFESPGKPLSAITDDVRERIENKYGFDCILGGTFEQVLQYVIRSTKAAKYARGQSFSVNEIDSWGSNSQFRFRTILAVQETQYGQHQTVHDIMVYRSGNRYDFIVAGFSSDFPGLTVPGKPKIPLLGLETLFASYPDPGLSTYFDQALALEGAPVPISELSYADLYDAISKRDEETMLSIIPGIADLEMTDSELDMLLILAINNNLDRVSAALLDHCNDINVIGNKPNYQVTPLYAATRKNNMEMVKRLLDRGADINVMGDTAYGKTAVHAAASTGNAEILQLLIKSGADLDSLDIQKNTVLSEAITCGKTEIVELILASGCTVNLITDQYKGSHLLQAIKEGKEEIAKFLIAKGADVTAADSSGATPLHEAAGLKTDALGIAKLLLEKGADVHAKQSTGKTPLHSAVWSGNKDIVQLLLTRWADPNAVAEFGGVFGSAVQTITPLMLANEKGYAEIAEMLRAAGATEYI